MEEIYKQYSKLVYNYLYSISNNSDISEELMQETFYSAITGIKKFRHECKISVWLCQIAKNKWIDYLKKYKKIQYISLENSLESENNLVENNLENDFNSKEEIISMYKKIHNLDENTREVFYLRIKGDLSFKDIGLILGKSEEWARITFYRGKIKLKEDFNNE